MSGIGGTEAGIRRWSGRRVRATSIPTCMVRKIWTHTADGFRIQPTARCGPHELRPVGPPIARGDGFGSVLTVGLGSATIRGAGRRITMGDGISVPGTAGAGIRARSGLVYGITGVQHWSHSWGSAMAASDSDLDMWAGCRWLRTSAFIPGT